MELSDIDKIELGLKPFGFYDGETELKQVWAKSPKSALEKLKFCYPETYHFIEVREIKWDYKINSVNNRGSKNLG